MMKIRLVTFALVLAPLFAVPAFVHASNPPLVLAATNWEPIMGEGMKNGGYLTEVVTTALKRAGYSVEIRWVPWKRALEMSKQGIYDGVIAASYTKERHRHFNCTLPIVSDDFAYFGLAHQRLNHDLFLHCNPVTIGVLRGSAIIQTLQKNKNITIDQANNHNQNIKKLLAERINFIIAQKSPFNIYLPGNSQINKRILSSLSRSTGKINTIFFSPGKAPNTQILSAALIKHLIKMQKEGVIDKILHEHNLDQAVLPLNRRERTQL